MMAMVAAGDAAAAYPGVRFILMQRTARGGFRSTQDTVVALQALSEYAAAIYSRDVKLTSAVSSPLTLPTSTSSSRRTWAPSPRPSWRCPARGRAVVQQVQHIRINFDPPSVSVLKALSFKVYTILVVFIPD